MVGRTGEALEGALEVRASYRECIELFASAGAGTSRGEVKFPRSSATLADFDLIRRLGDGSYSQVLLGRLRATGEELAIKVMEKQYILRHDMVKYVLSERDILSRLSHPGVIRLLFTFQDKLSLYLALEYCPGGELFDQIRMRGKLEEDAARHYAAQLVDILCYLGEQGIVHRDLKPENMLIGQDGRLVLVDFGSAKELPGAAAGADRAAGSARSSRGGSRGGSAGSLAASKGGGGSSGGGVRNGGSSKGGADGRPTRRGSSEGLHGRHGPRGSAEGLSGRHARRGSVDGLLARRGSSEGLHGRCGSSGSLLSHHGSVGASSTLSRSSSGQLARAGQPSGRPGPGSPAWDAAGVPSPPPSRPSSTPPTLPTGSGGLHHHHHERTGSDRDGGDPRSGAPSEAAGTGAAAAASVGKLPLPRGASEEEPGGATGIPPVREARTGAPAALTPAQREAGGGAALQVERSHGSYAAALGSGTAAGSTTSALEGSGRRCSFVGTADYVSPEVLRNEPITLAADLWSLGAVVSHMLRGEPPFRRASEYATLEAVLAGEAGPLPPEVSPEAADFVSRLLRQVPSDRLGAQDLGSQLKGHPWFRGTALGADAEGEGQGPPALAPAPASDPAPAPAPAAPAAAPARAAVRAPARPRPTPVDWGTLWSGPQPRIWDLDLESLGSAASSFDWELNSLASALPHAQPCSIRGLGSDDDEDDDDAAAPVAASGRGEEDGGGAATAEESSDEGERSEEEARGGPRTLTQDVNLGARGVSSYDDDGDECSDDDDNPYGPSRYGWNRRPGLRAIAGQHEGYSLPTAALPPVASATHVPPQVGSGLLPRLEEEEEEEDPMYYGAQK